MQTKLSQRKKFFCPVIGFDTISSKARHEELMVSWINECSLLLQAIFEVLQAVSCYLIAAQKSRLNTHEIVRSICCFLFLTSSVWAAIHVLHSGHFFSWDLGTPHDAVLVFLIPFYSELIILTLAGIWTRVLPVPSR